MKLKIKYLYCLLIFISFPILSEDIKNSVSISEIKQIEPSVNVDSESITNGLRKQLEKKGFSISKIKKGGLKSELAESKKQKNKFHIRGNYQKKDNNSNLYLYAQVYDPDTGYLIDAFNLTDYAAILKDIELDKEELKEDDSERILKFSERVANIVYTNPSKKENKNNIESYITGAGIERKTEVVFSPVKESSEESADDVFDLLQSQVTVSATKVEKKVNEAPNLVSIISAKDIKEYGRVSINDILYQLPGFAPSHDYDRNTVSSRGMFEGWNNNHLLMLIDGVQFNDSLYGTAYTWEVMPLNMVKSIEVIRGPGSALYGSNATNGVISLNTYSGSDLKGESRIRARMGDYGTRIVDFLTGNTTPYASYVASANFYGTNGNEYESYDGSFRTDDFGFYKKFEVKDARENNYAFVKIEAEKALKGLSFQYHRQKWDYKTGHGWLWRIPDINESMKETMETFSMKYNNKITDKLIQEYVVRYQVRTIDWSMRYAEMNGYDAYYPNGIDEYLKTGANELLARAQYTYLFGNGGSALVGVEGTRFQYKGDKQHYSNTALSDAANEYPPNENNAILPMGPWLEWIKGRNVPKGAIFGQVVSGKFLYDKLELTLGIRYDEKYIKYKGIDSPYTEKYGLEYPFYPEEKRVFRRTSPRAGLVVFIMNGLNLKFMAGRAFREPSITELFGANTFTLASNPRELKPEIINTQEAALDWFITKNLNFKLNFFNTKFENQIAYSVANNNLSTNIYTLHHRGVESELIYEVKKLSYFMNFSYNQRVNEAVLDNTISQNKKALTWAPTNTQNFGVRGEYHDFSGSVSLQRQGPVYRRNSDFGTVDFYTNFVYVDPYAYPQYRSRVIPEWYNMNLRLSYNVTSNLNIGIFVSNALNRTQHLIKNFEFPFDYRRETRRVMLDVSAHF